MIASVLHFKKLVKSVFICIIKSMGMFTEAGHFSVPEEADFSPEAGEIEATSNGRIETISSIRANFERMGEFGEINIGEVGKPKESKEKGTTSEDFIKGREDQILARAGDKGLSALGMGEFYRKEREREQKESSASWKGFEKVAKRVTTVSFAPLPNETLRDTIAEIPSVSAAIFFEQGTNSSVNTHILKATETDSGIETKILQRTLLLSDKDTKTFGSHWQSVAGGEYMYFARGKVVYRVSIDSLTKPSTGTNEIKPEIVCEDTECDRVTSLDYHDGKLLWSGFGSVSKSESQAILGSFDTKTTEPKPKLLRGKKTNTYNTKTNTAAFDEKGNIVSVGFEGIDDAKKSYTPVTLRLKSYVFDTGLDKIDPVSMETTAEFNGNKVERIPGDNMSLLKSIGDHGRVILLNNDDGTLVVNSERAAKTVAPPVKDPEKDIKIDVRKETALSAYRTNGTLFTGSLGGTVGAFSPEGTFIGKQEYSDTGNARVDQVITFIRIKDGKFIAVCKSGKGEVIETVNESENQSQEATV